MNRNFVKKKGEKGGKNVSKFSILDVFKISGEKKENQVKNKGREKGENCVKSRFYVFSFKFIVKKQANLVDYNENWTYQ